MKGLPGATPSCGPLLMTAGALAPVPFRLPHALPRAEGGWDTVRDRFDSCEKAKFKKASWGRLGLSWRVNEWKMEK